MQAGKCMQRCIDKRQTEKTRIRVEHKRKILGKQTERKVDNHSSNCPLTITKIKVFRYKHWPTKLLPSQLHLYVQMFWPFESLCPFTVIK